MTKYRRINWTILVWVFFSIAALFSTCKEDKHTVYTPPPVANQQANFFLSWLAECTSDTAVVTSDSIAGLRTLTELADARTTAAITDPVLVNAYGSYGTAPAWGPALSISTPGDTVAITDNMLYAVRSESGEEIIYSIGVAGTNAISFFDWFTEDFNVGQAVPWIAPDGTQHGSIAIGSQTGLEILTSLANDTSTSILDFIQQELSNSTSDKTYKIVVTGHSLGGALSPLLALYIKERLTDADVRVEAWPYAGPTPGDKPFADYLVATLDAYHAFNNNYDVVPHVWELDSLDRLCTIYAEQPTVCDSSLLGQTIVQAFAQWAIGQSKASGINYHMAGQPNTFDGSPLVIDSAECAILPGVPLLLDTVMVDTTNLLQIMVDIAKQCGSDSGPSELSAINNFVLYFLDVGYQHTDAYESKFFPNERVAEQVNLYVGQASLTEDLPYLAPTLGHLTLDINNYVNSKGITDCACPD